MITLLLILLVVGVAISIVRRLPPSSCTGDCNQGRNCNCVTKTVHPTPEEQRRFQLEDEFNNSNWPFPVDKKP